MQLDDLPLAIEQLRYLLDLVHQAFGITHTVAGVAGNDTITAAVKAGAEAVRYVQIQGERPVYGRLISVPRAFDEVRDVEGSGGLRSARIRCGATRRGGVASQTEYA